jgi:hypothetical protein
VPLGWRLVPVYRAGGWRLLVRLLARLAARSAGFPSRAYGPPSHGGAAGCAFGGRLLLPYALCRSCRLRPVRKPEGM